MKLLVVTEDPSLHDTLCAALPSSPGVELAHVTTVAQAFQAAPVSIGARSPFDLCVLDYQKSDLPGLKGVTQLSTHLHRPPMALLIDGGSLELAQRALRAGANAVMSRSLDVADMTNALRLALTGQYLTVFPHLTQISEAAALNSLSDREVQVLRGLCDGLQNKEIAHAFSIQEVTVKMHMRSVVRKLGAKNRTHAAMIARDMHLI